MSNLISLITVAKFFWRKGRELFTELDTIMYELILFINYAIQFS